MKNMLAELLIQPWAMEPKALEAFIARVGAGRPAAAVLSPRYVSRGPVHVDPAVQDTDWAFLNDLSHVVTSNGDGVSASNALFGEDAPKRTRMSIASGVARIPISGVLLKKVPAWLRWFGVDATSYQDIMDDTLAAAGNADVKEICYVVDSPGGQVAGVHEAGEAIHAARGSGKQITAEVGDLCASAAYWLAAQAQRITAGPNAQIGSIGVYSVYVDSSKAAADEGFKVHVISSGPHKGAGVPGAPITDEQLAGFQKVIDGMAANFKEAVSRGRGKGADKVGEWATGQVWLAREAVSMGLIDSLKPSRSQGPAGGPSAASDTPHVEETSMSDPKEIAAGEEKIRAEAVKNERAAEQKRVADIRAAFPEDPAFAMDQAAKGASVEQAKIAYADVLQERNKKAAQENAELRQQLSAGTKTAGADPLAGSAAGGTGKVEDFMEVAKAYQKENGGSFSAAMSHIASTRPEIHQAFLAKQEAKAGEFAALKRKHGMA
jgi:signal peptide peptidase SppA